MFAQVSLQQRSRQFEGFITLPVIWSSVRKPAAHTANKKGRNSLTTDIIQNKQFV
jgi:hypothetical protein